MRIGFGFSETGATQISDYTSCRFGRPPASGSAMSFEQSSLSAVPRPQTSLVGRSTEIAAIHNLLVRPDVRMLTLTGPGGAGKTRLALHAALTIEGFPNGRWFVELAGLSDPALIVPQIGKALGLRDRGTASTGDQIVDALDGRDALLVLDNFEHLLDGATAISQLVSRTTGLTVLVTSRSPLNLANEHVVAIGALDVTKGGAGAPSEAAELFLQRSRAIRPGYDPAPADVQAIEEICLELSGIPLAIELAAARIRVMAPQALLTRLAQPLRLLTAGPQDAPERHRSMRDAIDWSYRLLDDEQRALLREMGVFAGSAPLDGIELVAAAAGIGGPDEAVDLLARLADASMIEPYERETKTRFLLSAAVREFVVEELQHRGELSQARDRHAAWVEALTDKLQAEFAGPREHLIMSRARAELDNIRTAIGWSLETGNIARAARILGNFGDFWSFGGQSNEGKRWLDRIEPLLERAELTAAEQHRFWMTAGLIAWSQGDAALAAQRYLQSCEIASASGDRAAQAMSLMWQAQAAWYTGDYEAQHQFASESLALSPERSVSWAGAQTLYGIAEMRLDRLDVAEQALEYARERHAEIGFVRAEIWTLQLLGDLAMLRGNTASSARWHRESLALALHVSDNWGIFEDLSGLIAIALELGWNEEALELLASAELLMTASSVMPREGSSLSDDDRARLKAGLTPDALQVLAQNAASRSVPRLVARASEIAHAIETGQSRTAPAKLPAKRAARVSHPFDLSPREQTVLALLVQGMTDRQVSAELGISHGTARSHVAHVLQKLDARNRAAAVRKALELELV